MTVEPLFWPHSKTHRKDDGPLCINCPFWESSDVDPEVRERVDGSNRNTIGECRRRPRVAHSADPDEHIYPLQRFSDWCGMHPRIKRQQKLTASAAYGLAADVIVPLGRRALHLAAVLRGRGVSDVVEEAAERWAAGDLPPVQLTYPGDLSRAQVECPGLPPRPATKDEVSRWREASELRREQALRQQSAATIEGTDL